MKIRTIYCPYCNVQMKYMGTKRIQLGRTGFIIGDWDNLLSGALTASIYECPKCGKLEFFRFKKTKRKKDDTVTDI
ncbi:MULTISPECIES: hypothetical protein [Ruminococcus]|jgi:DNA-directed RNA polymerase subunit RPC12/RpoP|uniref:Nucleic-acid-binding protein containing Zn-ribbon domain n=1 Tax=Ruminococcus flavefaciens TaxID=1265 RepID=A0A315YLQ3_RUMFL|nr:MULTISPECIES: hypothetical protein [Ruminococcus]MBQ6169428.1 hypothetical protein [Ruminococcus sp.]MBR1429668.1 hypothetical protein [Ruminococcus sp.]PWJ12596.1 hypothetical protein IE37_01679 [Ruminococcus flavefaciens]SSA49075.1 hypothetical protein SAMN02910325_01679 [Ruminococcus flavefaciens]